MESYSYQRLETDDDIVTNSVECFAFTFIISLKFMIAIGILITQNIIICFWGTYIILFYSNLTGEAESVYNFTIAQTMIAYCYSAGLGAETYTLTKQNRKKYSSSINIINIINLFISNYISIEINTNHWFSHALF